MTGYPKVEYSSDIKHGYPKAFVLDIIRVVRKDKRTKRSKLMGIIFYGLMKNGYASKGEIIFKLFDGSKHAFIVDLGDM